VAKIVRTTLAGWRRYRNHPDPRIRRRFVWETQKLATTYSAAIWAMRRYYRRTPAMRAKLSRLQCELHRDFGLKSRLFGALGGPYVLWRTRREEKRLGRGWTYEPPTFYEKNDHAPPTHTGDSPRAERCRYVTPRDASVRAGALLPLTQKVSKAKESVSQATCRP
jgi:hypothetical protein